MAAILDAPQTFTKGAGDMKLETLKKAGNVAIAVAVLVELNNCSWSRRTGTLRTEWKWWWRTPAGCRRWLLIEFGSFQMSAPDTCRKIRMQSQQSQISQKTFLILYLFGFQGNGRCGWQGREPSEPVQLYRPLHVIGRYFVTLQYHYRAPYVMTVTTVGLDLYYATKSNYCWSVPTSPDVLAPIGHLLNPKESPFSFLWLWKVIKG